MTKMTLTQVSRVSLPHPSVDLLSRLSLCYKWRKSCPGRSYHSSKHKNFSDSDLGATFEMKQFKWLQVSTWFANARRRLKKENGGNCSIKRREEGEDDDDDMAELDRPSSSASNISCGSNIKEGECGVI